MHIFNSRTSKAPDVMHLLRCLLVAAALLFSCHIAGTDNKEADALSRFDFQRFHHLAPHAAPGATPIPSMLLAQLPVI